MYRSTDALVCPACGAALAPVRATFPLSGCASCGGLWLGPEAAVHVMRGLGDALDAELESASTSAAKGASAPSTASDSGVRACPACQAPMARLVVEDVIVDSCAAHGTWFDRHEVSAVVKACRKLRTKQSRASQPNDITAAGVAEGVGVVATGVASLAWGGLVGLVEALLSSGDERTERTRWEE